MTSEVKRDLCRAECPCRSCAGELIVLRALTMNAAAEAPDTVRTRLASAAVAVLLAQARRPGLAAAPAIESA
jgi:hypothetical protein